MSAPTIPATIWPAASQPETSHDCEVVIEKSGGRIHVRVLGDKLVPLAAVSLSMRQAKEVLVDLVRLLDVS